MDIIDSNEKKIYILLFEKISWDSKI